MKKVVICILSIFCFCMNDQNGSVFANNGVANDNITLQPSIPVSPSSVELFEGETKQLSAGDYSTDSSSSLVWTSSNEDVATVSGTGLVTAVAEGRATITCTVKMESAYFLPPSGNCVVTVKKKNVQPQNITFADAEVKRICVKNWDTDGDGELSYDEAADVTDIGEIFSGNATISFFNELAHFTNLTSIVDEAFRGCTALKSLTLPISVTSIGYGAFRDCNITSIIIPKSVVSIDVNLFSGCNSLESVVVETGNSVYDSRGNCNAIIETASNILVAGCKNTIIPNNVSAIGDGAFRNCSGMTTLNIPNNVTSIGSYAFADCHNMTTAKIPNSVTTLSICSFENCISLTSVTIPGSVTTIENEAFRGCGSLSSLNISDGVTTICGYAFKGCSSLTSITLPNSVTNIYAYAFQDCSGLTSVAFPTNITSIDEGVFNRCSSLVSVSIPDKVTTIEKLAFSGCTSLASVNIPNRVNSIGDYAFSGCGLISITIPIGIKSIGERAFSGCGNLNSVTVKNDSPISIQENVFSNRTNATLYVPVGCKAAYEAANYWKEFKEIVEMEPESTDIITFADAEVKRICVENWDIDGDGNLSFEEAAGVKDLGERFKDAISITSFDELQYFTGLTSIPYRAFYNCEKLSSMKIPESVTSIGMGAFVGCDLKSIYIPKNVASIGGYAFERNKNLTSIRVDDANSHYDSRALCNAIIETSTNTLIQGCKATVIPSDISEIGAWAFEFVDVEHIEFPQCLEKISWCAFYGCSKLKDVVFPDGLKRIDRYAFNGCIGLKSIELPGSIEYVGGSAFSGCYNIEALSVEQSSETYISPKGCNAIISKDGLTLVIGCKNTLIPESVSIIGSESFSDLPLITTISIPDGVTTIEDAAFRGCYGLSEINIPHSIERIGENAFAGCWLKSVTVRRDVPLEISDNVFTNRTSASLYVPKGSKTAYESASYWQDFKEIVELTDDEPEQINVTDISSMANAIYIEPFVACRNSDVYIEVRVKNAEVITSYGFELVLPVGMSITTDEEGSFNDAISLSPRNSDHVVMTNKISDNSYKIAVISFSAKGLTGHGGIVLTAKAHVAEDIPFETFAVKVQNPMIVYEDYSKPLVQETVTTVTIEDNVGDNTDIAALDNVVYINNVEGFAGQQLMLSVKMKNAVQAEGFGFDLYLPEGVTVARDEDGFPIAELSTARTTARKTNSFDAAFQGDGCLRVLAASTNGSVISGNDGEVCLVTVNISEGMEEGDYPILLKNIAISDVSAVSHRTEQVKSTLTVSAYKPGDANNDGVIDVSDFTATAHYLLGYPPESFNIKAADANADDIVDVADLTAIAHIILYGSVSRPNNTPMVNGLEPQ